MNNDLADLLRNYAKHRARAKALEFGLAESDDAEESKRLTAQLDFLDYCMTLLAEQDRDQHELLQMVYMKKYGLRGYAKVKYMAKSTADRKKAQALHSLKALFECKKFN